MSYGVFESTNLYSSRLYSAMSETDVENGTVGYIEELVEGETKIYKFVKGVVEGKQIVVVDQPAWDADTCKTSNQRKDKFICKANVPFRVRELTKFGKFSISIDCVAVPSQANMDTGVYLTVDTNGKFVVSSTPSEDAVLECYVESKRVSGGSISTVANNYGYTRLMYKARITTLK